jgi:hypothetical protein
MRLQLLVAFAVLSFSSVGRADSIAFSEFDHEYINQSGSVSNATGTADVLYFHAAVGPVSETIDLTNGAGVVTDTIFSPSGMFDFAFPGDAFEFAGVASGNAAIGTQCVASSTVACVVNTGGTLNLTSIVNSQSDNGLTFTLESGSLTV